MINHNPTHKTILDTLLLDIPGVSTGQMFGHPSYYVAGKLFACVMEQGIAIKVPETLVNHLLMDDRVTPFAPGGTRMRQWVQINPDDPSEYADYRPFFEQSIQFVAEQVRR